MNNFIAQVYEADRLMCREIYWHMFRIEYRDTSELIHLDIPMIIGDVVINNSYSVETIGL